MMTLILFLAVVAALSWPVSRWLLWTLRDDVAAGSLRARFDGGAARVVGSGWQGEQTWPRYLLAMLLCNGLLFAISFFVLTNQHWLPLNPDGKVGLSWDLALNTAISFTTNTNLQHYSGDAQLSYLSQLVAILLPQFLSAATGIAALAAIARALAGSGVGNFLRDLTRVTVLFLLPLSLLLGGALILCNMPMTLQGAAQATTLEGVAQTIARGPVAAIVAIKQLGTNGGGYFGPNSTHPFENPSFLSNLLENGAILLIPMALVWYFGAVIGRLRHAATLFAVMTVVFIVLVSFASSSESQTAPALQGLPVAEAPNLEGKEMRFGTDAGALWAVSTTATSNGSVNAMHDSLNPLTGLAPLTGMWLNITFGGVGVGLINMLVFVVVAVFCAGLMVGRTPEYLGRKVESREMTLATFTILLHPLLILGGTALFIATGWAAATIQDPGHHGLSEVVYEFSSAAANNGSGFEGLGDNTPAWNIATGLAMLLGRFLPIVLPLAIAASLGAKPRLREHAGTFRSDSPTFALILLAVILIVGALLFLPVAMVGPVAEHLAGPATAAGVTP